MTHPRCLQTLALLLHLVLLLVCVQCSQQTCEEEPKAWENSLEYSDKASKEDAILEVCDIDLTRQEVEGRVGTSMGRLLNKDVSNLPGDHAPEFICHVSCGACKPGIENLLQRESLVFNIRNGPLGVGEDFGVSACVEGNQEFVE